MDVRIPVYPPLADDASAFSAEADESQGCDIDVAAAPSIAEEAASPSAEASGSCKNECSPRQAAGYHRQHRRSPSPFPLPSRERVTETPQLAAGNHLIDETPSREDFSVVPAEELMRAFKDRLNALGTPAEKLGFLRYILVFLAGRPTDYLRFSPSGLISGLYFVSSSADKLHREFPLTNPATASHNALVKLISDSFEMAHPLERQLIMKANLTDATSMLVAQIHLARALRVTYDKAWEGIARQSRSGTAYLAMMMLQLHDTAWRYQRLFDKDKDSLAWHESTLERIREIKLRHALPEDDLAWALGQVQRLVTAGAERVSSFHPGNAEIYRASKEYMAMMEEISKGLYLFSTRIYQSGAESLSAHDMPGLARIFAMRAAEESVAAKRLGL